MEHLANVNWMAVFAATIATFLLGWLWHSDLLFGKKWRALTGVKPDKKGMGLVMIKGVMNTFMINLALAVLLVMMDPPSMKAALMTGVFVWIAVSLYEHFGKVIWEKGNPMMVLIGGGHTLLVIMASVFIQMKMA